MSAGNKVKLNTDPFPGWPSGLFCDVMFITLTMEDISNRYGLVSIRDEDELGGFEVTHFIDEDIGPVVLVHYDYASRQSNETMIWVDYEFDIDTATKRLVDVLQLQDHEILEMRNTADEMRYRKRVLGLEE